MRSAILCLAAIAQFALAVTAEPEPIKIPLFRRTNDGVVTAAGKALDNGVLAGTIHIGTPPQEFTVAFDTSSGYSWIRGSNCKSTNCLDRCTYYARNSKTAVSTGEKFSVKYGSSCVDTYIYRDTVEFAGLTVKDMPFGGAYRMSGFGAGFDGYLGLGPNVDLSSRKLVLAPSTNSSSLNKRDTTDASGFIPNAYQQGSGVGSSQFGVYTTTSSGFDQNGGQGPPQTPPTNTTAPTTAAPPPAGTTTAPPPATTSVASGGFGFGKRTNVQEEQPAGYLVIGGIDKNAIEGDVEYLTLAEGTTADQGWDVCIKHAKIGKLGLGQEKDAIAAISTSSPYIVLPECQADEFQKMYGGKFYRSKGTYSVKCSEIKDLPPLKINLDDKIVQLPAKYWTREIDGDRDCCEVLLSKGGSPTDWILGVPFTNAFYTTFDPDGKRVGLGIKAGNTDKDLKIYDA
ncbi:aspartic peptidase domain-containing protein [Gongronella butleri]|nr:aspartic peptidase domain-containing protein [Gongronella butleri]